MFADFSKTFKEENTKNKQELPQSLVDYFSRTILPDGLKYQSNGHGEYVAIDSETNTQKITLGGLSPILTKEQEAVLGKNFSCEDIFDYSYNAQKPIPFKLINEGYITINGKQIKLVDWIKSPNSFHDKMTIVDKGELLLFPSPFPKPFSLELGCKEYKRTYEFHRIPNESVHAMAFEATEKQAFGFKYYVDTFEKTFSFTISFDINLTSSVQDLVETITLYNAFGKGEGTIMGNPLSIKKAEFEKYEFNPKTLDFWKKVLAIENILGEKYELFYDAIDINTVYKVELLYQSLVNHIPVRDVIKIDYLTSADNFNECENEFRNVMEEPIWYGLETMMEFNAITIKEKLPIIIGINNAIIKSIEPQEIGCRIVLGDKSPTEKKYTSAIFFKDVEALNEFKNEYNERLIDIFTNAKSPEEFL